MGLLGQPLIAIVAMALLGVPGLAVMLLGRRNVWLLVVGVVFITAAVWIGYNAFVVGGYVAPPVI